MSGVSRRSFLRAGAALGVAGAAGVGVAAATAEDPRETPGVVPFDEEHQAGILTPKPAHAAHVSFDVASRDGADLRRALQAISGSARRLAGRGDDLTVTIGLGASLFDDRFGLGDRRPPQLATLPRFPADAFAAPATDGDLLLQLCAASPGTVLTAHRELARATRGLLVPRWSIDGHAPADGRNALGFVDGTGNPDPADAGAMGRVVWCGSEVPAWARGGTHCVVRVTRLRLEAWDRTPLPEQEQAIGRTRGANRLLSPRPPASHIARARPRGEPVRMLRRPYTYSRGLDPTGELDAGLVFCAFERDPRNGVTAALARMAGEPLEAVSVATGGGAFFLPPGARGPRDWVGSGLLA